MISIMWLGVFMPNFTSIGANVAQQEALKFGATQCHSV